MKSKASAPGKVILFGEHFVVYGVKAVLCAISRRITVSAETVTENTISITSEIGQFAANPKTKLADVSSSLKPLFYLAKKMIEKYDHSGGITINVQSEIPSGVGLGSSSAVCVAGAAAVSALFEKLDRDEILTLAVEAEKTVYKNSSGADCTVCIYGGVMGYCKKDGFARIESDSSFKLVIANSNVKHSTEVMVSSVRRFKEENEERFLNMCDMEGRLVDEALSLMSENNLAGLGRCMVENQKMLTTMGVSSEDLERMVGIANATSFGGKITGAGGGGCVFALNDSTNIQDTIKHFREKNIECFSVEIDFAGLNTF